MILEALGRVLTEHCSGADIRRVEGGGSVLPMWSPIEQGGFLDLLLREEAGGANLPLPDLFCVLECMGRFAVPLPFAESIIARALVHSDVPLPGGILTLATHLQREADGSIVCRQTPCGLVTGHVLAAEGGALFLLSTANARRRVVGDPREQLADLRWDSPAAARPVPGPASALPVFAAAATAALLSGAMQRSFELSLEYCNQRVQFGKPLGKFQAVQQQLSVMAEHVLAGSIAAEAAFRTSGPTPDALAAAIAKSRCSEAAALVAATSHAVHGAIGMTDEYDLGILTRRLHSWRRAYGAEQYWNGVIGRRLLASSDLLLDFVRVA
ncbi:MAG: acyl-CoA dehydrogenase [Rhodoferax sp.]|nr:acyl-CoA dehydrogenase [Rhodoferax sp.]